jgi:hypothetical protein
MKTTFLKTAFAGLVLTASGFTNAGLVNVATIEITNAIGQPFQVSEVIAWDTLTNADLALSSAGALASATGYQTRFNGSCKGATAGVSSADCVIDGSGALSYNDSPYTYHGDDSSDVLSVTLASPSELDWFGIYGRTEHSERDVYNINFFDAQRNLLYSTTGLSANNAKNFASVELPNMNVSEPSTLAIFALGLMGFASRRFRKQS